jgi:hypothetical protein
MSGTRFPRAAAVLEAAAAAEMLRRAAAELDELAGTAHQVEPGTLRRRVRAIGLEVAFNLEVDAP